MYCFHWNNSAKLLKILKNEWRRAKSNFYAVTNGRENGVFLNWTRASDSVLGFTKEAKFKGFSTYEEAAAAMESADYGDYWVFDDQSQVSRAEYEAQRMPNMRNAIDLFSKTDSCDTELQSTNAEVPKFKNVIILTIHRL